MLTLEYWRDVPGYEGRYQVSNCGNVRSLPGDRRAGRILAPNKMPNGYLGIILGRGSKMHMVHRLVASAFVTGDTALQVNHKNGSRASNRASNLEWTTCSDNHRHSYRELTRKKHALTRRVTVGAVTYGSVLEASRACGVAPGSIASAALKGHRCKGQEVRYV